MSKEVRAMNIQRGDSTFDRILAHHTNPEAFPLTPTEQNQMDRWYEAFTLLRNHRTKQFIVNIWTKPIENGGKGLSLAQAYIDIKNAESLFGNVLKSDKEAKRALWLVWAEEQLARAIQKGNDRGVEKMLDMIAKYTGLGNEDDAQFNAEKLQNYDIEIKLSAKYEKILSQYEQADGNFVDFNSLDAVNVDFEDVTTDEDGKEDS